VGRGGGAQARGLRPGAWPPPSRHGAGEAGAGAPPPRGGRGKGAGESPPPPRDAMPTRVWIRP